MITRREFTKTLGGVAALATFSPALGWALDEPKVSADATKIYRVCFVLDGNALASIVAGAPRNSGRSNSSVTH